jgi:BMFP domain-containing protein YqiC
MTNGSFYLDEDLPHQALRWRENSTRSGCGHNAWARESADSFKAKIHDEVEATVLKMGFVKREEFDRLVARVDAWHRRRRAAPAKKAAPQESCTSKKSAPRRKLHLQEEAQRA